MMTKAMLRWIFPLIALLVVGPAAAAVVAGLHAIDGSSDTTLLLNSSPGLGLVAFGAVAAGAIVLGGLAGHLTDRKTAITSAALVIAWGAMRTGDTGHVLARVGAGAVPALLLEIGLASGLVVVMLLVIERATGRGKASVLTDLAGLRQPTELIVLGAGVVATLAASWLVAFTSMPGQTLLAAILGGAAGGAASHLMGSAKSAAAPTNTGVIAVLVAAVLGVLSLAVVPGLGGLASAARAGSITGPGLVQPLMWAAGALLGVQIGFGWAGASLASAGALPGGGSAGLSSSR